MDGGMELGSVARAGQPLPYTGRQRDWDRLGSQFSAALLSGDETGARRVFERLRLARVPLVDQTEQLLGPAMRRLGAACGVGTLSGARLRVAAGIAERALVWAVSCLDDARLGAPGAVVITPPGDDHRLPALMAAAVLRDGGWVVRQIEGLGAGEVVALARRCRPALAVVSYARYDLGDAVEQLVGPLAGAVGIPVLVGGPGKRLGALQEHAALLYRPVLGELDSRTGPAN